MLLWGSIGTAIVQTFSAKGEARATAADRVTNAAGNLADRLDKLNTKLEEENTAMRKAMVALTEAVEDMFAEVQDRRFVIGSKGPSMMQR